MKTKTLFYFFAFVFLSMPAFSEKNKNPTLHELVNLEKNEVKQYEGYKFDITWAEGFPVIDVTYVQVDKTDKRINVQDVALINSKQSVFETAKITMELMKFQVFKPVKVVQSDVYRNPENGDAVFRFDSYGKDGAIRFSEWRDSENGFPVKKILFNEQGEPIGGTIYFGLKINLPFSMERVKNFNRMSLEGACESYKTLIRENNFDDVSNICSKMAKAN